MKEKYHAVVFFDLDGTLLNNQSLLDEDVIQAVHQLKEQQVLPVICTGRSNCEIEEIQAQTGITSAITLNGQRIILNGEVIYQHFMADEEVQRFIHFAKERQDEVAFYNADHIYLTDTNTTVCECYERMDAPLPEVKPSYPKHHHISMMLVFRDADEVDNEYRNAFPEFEFYRNGPKAMDIVSRGQSKGTAIRILKDYLDLRETPTFAFGDGSNDFAMFANVDYPIAMGNAIPALQEQAVYITKKNIEGGIRHGLEHFHLI